MVEKYRKICLNIILVMILILSLTGCNSGEEQNKTIEDKIDEEISYIENKILTFFTRYAKGEYGNNNDLDWSAIDENITELNDILDTLILDLSDIEVGNENIIAFRNELNELSIAASNKNINLVVQKYAKLYSLLPTYKKQYSNNKNSIYIMELKSLIISSFAYSNDLDWENAKNTMILAETKYKEMMDDIDYMQEYSYNLNKVYILIEELKSAVELEELELTKVKYVNFIEKYNCK